MIDYIKRLETLREGVEDCRLISKLATDPKKRAHFAEIADQLEVLVRLIERIIAEKGSGDIDPE